VKSYPIGGGVPWLEVTAASKFSEAEFKDLVAEFRQYGYDPYNSADDAQHWFEVIGGALNGGRLARAVPA